MEGKSFFAGAFYLTLDQYIRSEEWIFTFFSVQSMNDVLAGQRGSTYLTEGRLGNWSHTSKYDYKMEYIGNTNYR